MFMKADPTWSRKKSKHLHVDPTQACEQSCIWSWFENNSDGCAVETTEMIYRKISGTDACMVMHKNFEEYVVYEVKFRFHEDLELLRFSLSEWTDNSKNRGHDSIMQVILICHA